MPAERIGMRDAPCRDRRFTCKSVPLASRAKSATARVFAMRWPSVRTPQLHETGHLISARRLRRGDRRNLNSGKSA